MPHRKAKAYRTLLFALGSVAACVLADGNVYCFAMFQVPELILFSED